MRRISVALTTLVVLGLIALNAPVGAGANVPGWTHSTAPVITTPTLKQCSTIVRTELYAKGHLTIATDNPVYAPWFINNTPSNDEGYESALTYLIAKDFNFAAKNVKWVTEPYADSYQSGSKPFDFDINEIAYNATWANNVNFSSGYYQVQQSLVAMKSDAIVKKHSAKVLPNYKYGALAGSPALGYVTNNIKPKVPVTSFATLGAAEVALEAGRIDAIAVDTPTGNHIVNWDIVTAGNVQLATQVGQFPANGDEYYAVVLQKKNPLTSCVDVAIATLIHNGSVKTLTKKWLTMYTSVPKLTP
jgi:polar amino acid transport system substrate-binding protein